MQHTTMPVPVMFAASADYTPTALARSVPYLFEGIGFLPSRSERILLKPNLLRAGGQEYICSNAKLVAAVCRYVRDCGCDVRIGDSPGFGTAAGVARSIGLPQALAAVSCADVPIITLDAPVSRPLTFGGSVGISRHALEADRIVNIPKLKTHSQMRITCAVKNLFGCVSGVRKAVLHTLHGDTERGGAAVFPAVVADIASQLPPVVTLLDAVTAMHITGPSNGKPFHAGLLAASLSPVALDTALYALLDLSPEAVPLWNELQRRRMHGAFPDDIVLVGEPATSFDVSSFVMPERLIPQTFNPFRLALSAVRRLWARVAG